MTRALHLHIGMNKAGSTSIQKGMLGYDDGQLRYLDVGNSNHSGVMLAFAHQLLGRPLPSKPWWTQQSDFGQVLPQLDAQIAAPGASLIVSGEGMGAKSMPKAAIAPMIRHFEAQFDTINVIAYVREPVAFIRSSMQQRLRHFHGVFDPATYWPHYRRRFEPWQNVLSRRGHMLTFVPFDRDHFAQGDLVVDFAQRVGADPAKIQQSRVQNRSMSAEGFAALWVHHRTRLETGGPIDHEQERRILLACLRAGQTPFAIDPDACRAVMQQEREDIAWIEDAMGVGLSEYRPIKGGVMFRGEADILDYAKAHPVPLGPTPREALLDRTRLLRRGARAVLRRLPVGR